MSSERKTGKAGRAASWGIVVILAAATGMTLSAGSVAAPGGGRPGPINVHVPPPSLKPSMAPRPMKIMTGFDSITAGANGLPTDSYRDELSVLLHEAGKAHTFHVTALPGSRCTYWVEQMPALLALHNPDVVLINCGTNDPAFTVADRELLGQSYRQIVEAIHTHNPHARILMSLLQISRVDPGGPAWLPDNEIRVNEVIAFNADYYLPYWDVGLVDFSLIPATVENNPDGVHPSPIGELKYANAWFVEGRRLGWW